MYYAHKDKGGFPMGIIYQTDKRLGITYAYENQSFWDPELKRSRSKRKLIGRVDPEPISLSDGYLIKLQKRYSDKLQS